ncbi:MAG: DUF4401 domain-containing protein [Gammaproteobacteria bacterium]|nr:DUF4401 domain-containing protein [Gammaproteobacteria bacterium]
MSNRYEILWGQLGSANIVTGEPPSTMEVQSPWYVRVMLGFSGWIAALFLLGFIGFGLEFIVDSEVASMVSGAIMLGIAYVIFSRSNNDFYEQFGLALSFAGQALILLGLFEFLGWRDRNIWWLVTALQATVAVVMPNFIQRLVAGYIAAHTLAVTLALHGAPFITAAMITLVITIIWANEFRWSKWGAAIRPIGYGLTLALIQLKGHTLFGISLYELMEYRGAFQIHIPQWLGQAVNGLLLIGVVAHLLSRMGESWTSSRMIIALITTTLIAAISLQAPGIASGFIILLLGFSSSNRILVGLGIAALLFYISSYYYTLETTLMIKSEILAATGATLLIVRGIILKWVFPKSEAAHA